MLERFRTRWAMILGPIARFLLARGVSADLVTVVGTAGVVVGALICFPNGWLWQGVVVVTIFIFSDMIDGQMAKISGKASPWGAFLDSSLDRFGDGAVFGGLVLWFAVQDQIGWAAVTLAALVMGQLTSYVKARAESLGFTCSGGVAARADRLFIILLGTLLAGFGVPYVLPVAVSLLAVAGVVTVGQRIAQVRRQSGAPDVRPA